MRVGEAPIEEITTAIKLGVPPVVAAVQHGVLEDEFIEWMRRGQTAGRGEAAYAKFYEAIRSAEALCETALVGVVRRAAGEHWQAAVWLLERRFPERYVRKSVSDEQGKKQAGQPDVFAAVDAAANVTPIRRRRSHAKA